MNNLLPYRYTRRFRTKVHSPVSVSPAHRNTSSTSLTLNPEIGVFTIISYDSSTRSYSLDTPVELL